MTDLTETEALAQLAQTAASPDRLTPGEVYAVPNGNGSITLHDTDQYAAHPRVAAAGRIVNDSASFVSYLDGHGIEGHTEVFADSINSTVVAVIDSHGLNKLHGDEVPGWQKHKVQLKLEKTPAWSAWVEGDGTWFDQVDFAEFIDARAIDVRIPEAATLIELAQHFSAKRSVDFESSERIDNGQTRLVYKETIGANAGKKGDIEIPERLQLVLRPYVGGPLYFVYARFRYRLHGSTLKLGYLLERPQDILDAAFADIVTEIRDGKAATEGANETDTTPAVAPSPGFSGITYPIYYGRP